ncbi:MAG TPA: hypothetical protein VGJ20_20140 [Xanthobacteraceae bacterium]|jgi:hypothetical protein
MFKLTLVAAVVAAGIALPASAHSVGKRHHVAVHSSNKIDPPATNPLFNTIVPSPASQCEHARQLGWPSTQCAVY